MDKTFKKYLLELIDAVLVRKDSSVSIYFSDSGEASVLIIPITPQGENEEA